MFLLSCAQDDCCVLNVLVHGIASLLVYQTQIHGISGCYMLIICFGYDTVIISIREGLKFVRDIERERVINSKLGYLLIRSYKTCFIV